MPKNIFRNNFLLSLILILQFNNRKEASWICMNPLEFINEQTWGNLLDPYTTENLEFKGYQEVEWKKKKWNIIRDYPSFELGVRTPHFWLFFYFTCIMGFSLVYTLSPFLLSSITQPWLFITTVIVTYYMEFST